MTVIAETLPASRSARWIGRIMSGLVIVFLMIDGAIKLVPWPIVTETMDRMGYGSSETLARSLGLITIVCTALYAVPPTSILGAILLTDYLGGVGSLGVVHRPADRAGKVVRTSGHIIEKTHAELLEGGGRGRAWRGRRSRRRRAAAAPPRRTAGPPSALM